ncbi:MAG: hypothetical protein WC359_13310 [Dehalococcoidia bacterium]|jgi:hypothetical protein
MENTVVYGIHEAGIWKQAHAIARQFGCEAQDAYNEIVVQALEATVKNPDIVTKGPAYLLIAASNNTRNTFSKLYHTYQEQHGKTTVSYDVAMEGDDDEGKLDYADTLAQMTTTVDYELMSTVRQIVAGLDAESQAIAGYLYDGYKASEIARMTGMYPMQVSRIVKNLRTQLEGALL